MTMMRIDQADLISHKSVNVSLVLSVNTWMIIEILLI